MVVAADGQEGWQQFERSADIQVVISDWLMPNMDKLELCGRIRSSKRAHYTYVIVVTVKEGRSDYLLAMQAGADDFLSKPFDPEQLHAKLCVAERILKLRYEHMQLRSLLSTWAYCKNIRDDGDAWVSIERYMSRHTESDLTHGVCPTCAATVL